MNSTVPSTPPPTLSPWTAASQLLPLFYRVFPGVSARLLVDRFLVPWKRLPSLGPGVEGQWLEVDEQRVSYDVAGTGPLVILAHGWSGASSQFAELRGALLGAGFRVATFDAPAHGASSGKSSNAGQFGRTIEAVARQHGPALAIVGHSLGGLAAALCARALAPAGLVLLAPMPSFDFALDQFQEALRFDDGLRERIAVLVEQRARVLRSAARLEIAFEEGRPALLVHDVLDRRVPVQASRELASRYPSVEYVETDGLGHSKALDDAGIIERIVGFVRALPVSG